MDKLKFMIDTLLKENPKFNKDNIVDYEKNPKKLLRALMNVREPGEISQEFLEVQDEFLKNEIKAMGITDVNDLKPVGSEGVCSVTNCDSIYLWKGDIVTIKADCIVNAANKKMLGCRLPLHYCIDNAIHTFAGVQLRNECYEIMKKQGYDEPTGKAKITKGYNLPSKFIIHTVGPIIYSSVKEEDMALLKSSYYESLKLAEENKLESIVFCSISTGVFNFPKELAAKIAIATVDNFLSSSKYVKKVIFNLYREEDLKIYENIIKVGINE
ncbi:protein-ADP-ribose hydrolase [Miniphocaeibacter halophilus]|uniref:Protein-ADP-ribose hydrolase n=1 Tax=Miniphocaeibacter halophilus TaxID=2931922 RepID=A0AC61MRL4_9FIRM|nr:protein-ADP-ribose hydrolase [Miniphocaeibacter halophilus]QQK07084.1 protein-ADP-ribose hydrolase [Miniphocaeibacter halophilus]